MNRDIMLRDVCVGVDVWTSLGAKVCVFQNVSPEFEKGDKRRETF
jgi:hypothetical protein